MQFEFSLYHFSPSTADPNTSVHHSINSREPAEINELLLQVADGAMGEVHVSIHGDLISVGFPRVSDSCRTDPSLHGTRQALLWLSETGEKPIVSIADYGSLRDSVFAAVIRSS